MSIEEKKERINRIRNQPKLKEFGKWNFGFPPEVTGADLYNKTQEIISRNENLNFTRNLDIASMDISGLDISMFPADYLTFDSDTKFPSKEKLPEGFEPEKIMAEQKDPGLDIKKLHEQGITGKGVKLAIIDQPLSNHVEYSGKIKHYEEIGFGEGEQKGGMHGSFVTSLAIGEKCGAAPEAECYYFACPFVNKDKNQTSVHIAKCVERLIEINESLPDKDKIQMVSISGCFKPEHEGYDNWLKTIEKAKKSGLDIISADLHRDYNLNFNGMQRDISKSVDDLNAYQPITKKIDVRVEDNWFSKDNDKNLLFPCDHRTGASHLGDDKYYHSSRGGISWIVPHVAGMYALAKQVDPNCSLEKLWEQGLKSGVKKEGFNGIIADPVKMIKGIESEKIMQNKLSQENKNQH